MKNVSLSLLTVASFVKSKKSSAGYELANRVVSGPPPPQWRIIDGLPGAQLVKIEYILILAGVNQLYYMCLSTVACYLISAGTGTEALVPFHMETDRNSQEPVTNRCGSVHQ